MPRYFFNVRALHGNVTDKRGVGLTSEAIARGYAERIVRELKEDLRYEGGGFEAVVRDAEKELFVICFDGPYVH